MNTSLHKRFKDPLKVTTCTPPPPSRLNTTRRQQLIALSSHDPKTASKQCRMCASYADVVSARQPRLVPLSTGKGGGRGGRGARTGAPRRWIARPFSTVSETSEHRPLFNRYVQTRNERIELNDSLVSGLSMEPERDSSASTIETGRSTECSRRAVQRLEREVQRQQKVIDQYETQRCSYSPTTETSRLHSDLFACPITHEVMRDPVIAADGYSYEREAIQFWFDSGNTTSPMTNVRLSHTRLVPNQTLRIAIETVC